MFLAALQDLPSDVEEAAVVDGAGKWGVFRHVTVPHLRPTLVLVLTLGVSQLRLSVERQHDGAHHRPCRVRHLTGKRTPVGRGIDIVDFYVPMPQQGAQLALQPGECGRDRFLRQGAISGARTAST